jgi:hypothetical protein
MFSRFFRSAWTTRPVGNKRRAARNSKRQVLKLEALEARVMPYSFNMVDSSGLALGQNSIRVLGYSAASQLILQPSGTPGQLEWASLPSSVTQLGVTNSTNTISGLSVSGIASTSGLVVGAMVAGPGIPAGTQISSIDVSITISNAATASGTPSLTFTQTLTGTSTNGSGEIDNLGSAGPNGASGNLAVGMSVTSPVTGTIAGILSGNSILLSQNAGASVYTNVTIASTQSGTSTTGSTLITGLTSTGNLAIGAMVSGTGVSGTITGIFATITLSNASTGTGPALLTASQSLSGTANSSTSITGLTSTSNLAVGMLVSGTTIPANTTITSINSPTSITISHAATASQADTFTFSQLLIGTTGAGNASVSLGAANPGNIAVGDTVTGTSIPASTTVTGIGGQILISAAATNTVVSNSLNVSRNNELTISTGTIANGSGSLTNVGAPALAQASYLALGQQVSAQAFPNNNAVNQASTMGTTVTMASPSTVTGTVSVSFSIIGVAGDLDGTTSVMNVATTGFAIGDSVSGPGIPFGTTISGVGANSITLSSAATITANGIPLTITTAAQTGTVTSGANTITVLSAALVTQLSGATNAPQIYSSSALESPISSIIGPTVTPATATSLTVSGTATAGGTAYLGFSVPLTTNTTSGSQWVTFTGLNSTGAIAVGDGISGPGIPAGSTILAILPTITISNAATGSGSNSLTFTDTLSGTASGNQITGLASTAALSVGAPVTGATIPAGTTIAQINSTTSITLSTTPTAGAVTVTFPPSSGTVDSYDISQYPSFTFDPTVQTQGLNGARIYVFVIPQNWPSVATQPGVAGYPTNPPAFPYSYSAISFGIQQPNNPPNSPSFESSYPPSAIVEPTIDPLSGGGGLHIDVQTVDGFTFPLSLTLKDSGNNVLGTVGQPVPANGITRADIISTYQQTFTNPSPYAELVAGNANDINGQYEGLLNPGSYLLSNTTSALNTIWDPVLSALFTSGSTQLNMIGDDSNYYKGVPMTVAGPLNGVPGPFNVIQFTGYSDQAMMNPNGNVFNIFDPATPDPLAPNYTKSTGYQVFANDGVFNDSSPNVIALATSPPAPGAVKVVLGLERDIVSALNRGMALVGPTGTSGRSGGDTSNYWGTESNWYPYAITDTNPTHVQNQFSLFMHTATFGGVPIFTQPTTGGPQSTIAASGATESGTTVTITTQAAHNLVQGQIVTITGVGVTGYNGTFVVTGTTSTTFTYTAVSGLGNSGGGTAEGGAVPTPQGLLMNQAYGFAYDESPVHGPANLPNQPIVPSKYDPTPAGTATVDITVGPWFAAAGPVVTPSVSNVAANATTITIAGTGFDTTPGNNTVAFTLTRGTLTGTVMAATATQLTVSVTGTGLVAGDAINAVVTTDSVASTSAQVGTVQPVITPSTAGLSAIATTMTIQGFGFNSTTPGNNTVVFTVAHGTLTGTVMAATNTQLTVALTPTGLVDGDAVNAVVTTNSVASSSAQVATLQQVAPMFASSGAATLVVGQSGSFTIRAPGATQIVEVGNLPNNVTFTDNHDGTATLTGTPTFTTGVYVLTLFASNTAGSSQQGFSLSVGNPPTFTSADHTAFTAGTSATFPVTATPPAGTTLATTFAVTSGKLPTGVQLSLVSGHWALRGAPAVGTAGVYTFTIAASNSTGAATQDFTLTVNQAKPSFLSVASTIFTVGQAKTFAIVTTDYPTLATITQTGGASLASLGLSLMAIPSVPGTTTSGSTAVVVSSTADLAVGMTVAGAGITPGTRIAAINGTTLTLSSPATASGSPTLSFPGTTTITGTPTITLAPGTFRSFTISLTASGAGTTTQTFTLVVKQPAVAITSAANTAFQESQAGTFTVTATGFPLPTLSVTVVAANFSGTLTKGGKTVSSISNLTGLLVGQMVTGPGIPLGTTISSVGATSIVLSKAATVPGRMVLSATLSGLPGWLTFTPLSNGTATFTGTPPVGTAAEGLKMSVKATGTTNATQVFTLGIVKYSTASGTIGTFTTGTAGSANIASTYPAGTTFSIVNGTLPKGLTLTATATGVKVSGTPAAGTGGTYTFQVQANRSSSALSLPYTVVVNQPQPTITSVNKVTFTAGQAGTFTIRTTGFSGGVPSTVSIIRGDTGFVTITNHGDGTATLSILPGLGSGTYPLALSASSGAGTATQAFTLTIVEPVLITSLAATQFTHGQLGSFPVTTQSGSPVPVLSVTGLPKGIVFVDLGGGVGLLQGKAVTPGVFTLLITARSGKLISIQQFVLTVV